MSIPITPETKVGAFLEAYPELEQTLVGLAPEFQKLKNPILRRTVAKVATLEQAAKIAGIPVRDLVARLREAAGQPFGEYAEASEEPAAQEPSGPPRWFDRGRVRETVDADSLIAAGQHPLGRVRRHAAALAPGDICCLVSSFRPAPLIETLERDGFVTWTAREHSDRFCTYIARRS